MRKILDETITNITNATYNKIINNITLPKELDQLIIEFIKEVNNLEVNKIEPILKIILTKIVAFNGDINKDVTRELYEKLKSLENSNIIMIDNFISLFDEQKRIRIEYLSITYQIIKSFGKKNIRLNNFLLKERLVNEDIYLINKIINDEVYKYFQSFFDLNFNNKYFFKRITDCSSEVTKDANTEEMTKRMLGLTNIFGLKTLHKLNIEIISVRDYWNLPYLERVKYFRLFYIRANSIFKLYSKHYDMMLDIDSKILMLIKIDPLDYIDNLEDSSSSFMLSEEKVDKDCIFANEDNFCEEYYDENNSSSEESMELLYNCSEDLRDTPFISLDNLKEDYCENQDSNKSNEEDDNNEGNNSNEDNNSNEEIDNELCDLFVMD